MLRRGFSSRSCTWNMPFLTGLTLWGTAVWARLVTCLQVAHLSHACTRFSALGQFAVKSLWSQLAHVGDLVVDCI